MWELDCEESWVPKNWCFWTVVLEKTLEGPLDCKEIQPVHSEGDQSWVFFRRNDAKAKLQYFGHLMRRVDSVEKPLMLGGIGGRRRRGRQDEMAGWHHWLNGHEFEWTPGVGDGQGGLACCNSWGRKELDTTEQLNWTELRSLPCRDMWGSSWGYILLHSKVKMRARVSRFYWNKCSKNYWGFCLILLTKQEKGAVNSSRQTWYAGKIVNSIQDMMEGY